MVIRLTYCTSSIMHPLTPASDFLGGESKSVHVLLSNINSLLHLVDLQGLRKKLIGIAASMMIIQAATVTHDLRMSARHSLPARLCFCTPPLCQVAASASPNYPCQRSAML